MTATVTLSLEEFDKLRSEYEQRGRFIDQISKALQANQGTTPEKEIEIFEKRRQSQAMSEIRFGG